MRIFVACPSYRREHPAHLASRYLTARHFGDRVGFHTVRGDSCLARARATLFGRFLASPEPWTHMLQVDDDQSWGPAHLESLARLDLPLAGLRCAFKSDRPEHAGRCTTRWPDEIVRHEDSTLEARYLGGGFILWRRDTLESMVEAYPGLAFDTNHAGCPPEPTYAFWCERVVGRELLSEDYAACELAGRLGIVPRVWLGACSPHWTHDVFDREGKLLEQGRAYVPLGYARPELRRHPGVDTVEALIPAEEAAA